MAKYDPADTAKVETQVLAMVEAAKIAGKTTIFFDTRAMFSAMKFSKLTRNQFGEQLCDQLTGSTFHKKYGDWVACEYECEVWVMTRLAAPGALLSINDEGRNLFYNTNTRNKVKAKKQMVSVEIPADADPVKAAALMQELFANHQQ
jgi:hypothetical protein